MYFLRKHDVMFKKMQTTLFPVKFFRKLKKNLKNVLFMNFWMEFDNCFPETKYNFLNEYIFINWIRSFSRGLDISHNKILSYR